ncbi:hypothetical protein [Mycobacterium sp. Root265]|uniref:hypothetical protein n=1 Tax=Mycobacterium sp. Root265 TaxID=1736504 RepID=UPI000A75ED26|nr:hypothetical protein [Mycobacterium sp. Root265]
MTLPEAKPLNAFFVVLAILSFVPTAFFGLAFLFTGFSGGMLALTAWCGLWTFVWWSLRHR